MAESTGFDALLGRAPRLKWGGLKWIYGLTIVLVSADFATSKVFVFTLSDCTGVAPNCMPFDLHFVVPRGGAEYAIDPMLRRAGFIVIGVTVFEGLNVRIV